MKKVLVFGEILFDKFGRSKKIGGAPLNFASHFSMLGGESYLISAVGDDKDGVKAVQTAQKYGIITDYIANVRSRTGLCNVTLNNGTPSYELVKPVAYDEIPCPVINGTFNGLYFGTLAQRSEISRNTLFSLLDLDYNEVFFDINIRQNFYSKLIIESSLKKATVLKVSREEIGVFNELKITEKHDIDSICVDIAIKYNLKLVIVTLDKDGGMVYDFSQGKVVYSRKPNCSVVSTVGAGDSFSAAFFKSYLDGDDLSVCLEKAVVLSSYIVTKLGAICNYSKEIKKILLT